MLNIVLKVQKANDKEMARLEDLGLIKRLLPPSDMDSPVTGKSYSKRIYETNLQYGGHMLLFVSTNRYSSKLNYHPDKEDVLLINSGGNVKPIIWVFGNSSHDVIEDKIASGALTSQDFIALDIPFNDPKTSFFTVNEGIPHFEVTIPGPEPSPSFWVTEPNNLPVIPINLAKYQIIIEK